MCLFKNKDIFYAKFDIIQKGVSKEFLSGANNPTLISIIIKN